MRTCTSDTTVLDLFDFLCVSLNLINSVLPVLFALAVLAFFWGLVTYVYNLGGEKADDAQKKGRSLMIWAIIAFVIMLSVFGIIKVVQQTFGFENSPVVKPPEILKSKQP